MKFAKPTINKDLIYPGAFWVKRVFYISIIFLIGFNVFINQLQHLYLNKLRTITQNIGKTIDNSSFSDEDSWFSWSFDNLAWMFGRSDVKEYATSIREASSEIEVLGSYLNIAFSIISITGFLMWIPIIFSATWLYFDFKYGEKKSFVKNAILLAVLFNVASYLLLRYFVI